MIIILPDIEYVLGPEIMLNMVRKPKASRRITIHEFTSRKSGVLGARLRLVKENDSTVYIFITPGPECPVDRLSTECRVNH